MRGMMVCIVASEDFFNKFEVISVLLMSVFMLVFGSK